MPDLRRDPIVGRWVIISTERNARPHDFVPVHAARPLAASLCPFCPGQERLTPKEIMAYRPQPLEPNDPNWTVRVVPNKFPALQVEGGLDREGEEMGSLLDFALPAPSLLRAHPMPNVYWNTLGCSDSTTHTTAQLVTSQVQSQAMTPLSLSRATPITWPTCRRSESRMSSGPIAIA